MSEVARAWNGEYASVVTNLGLSRVAAAHGDEVRKAAEEAKEVVSKQYNLAGASPDIVALLERREFVVALRDVLKEQVEHAVASVKGCARLEEQVAQSASPAGPSKASATAWLDPAQWRVRGARSVQEEYRVLGWAVDGLELQNGLIREHLPGMARRPEQ